MGSHGEPVDTHCRPLVLRDCQFYMGCHGLLAPLASTGQPRNERGVIGRGAARGQRRREARRVSAVKSAAGSSQRPGNADERYSPSSPIGRCTNVPCSRPNQ